MADLKKLMESLGIAQPSFNMTAPENLTVPPEDLEPATEADDEDYERDPANIPSAAAKFFSPKLATDEEIAAIQSMPLPEAQKSIRTPTQSPKPTEVVASEDPNTRRKNLLEELQKQRSNTQMTAGMLKAGNQIAQAMAAGYGGKIGDGADSVKMIQEMGEQPIKDYAEKIANEENDPQSDVSRFMREKAYDVLRKLNPQKKYDLENMTANQLKKVFGNKLIGGVNERTAQQAQFISKSTGNAYVFDPNTAKYIDAVTGKEAVNGDMVRPVAYNDAFGNRAFVSPLGNVEVMSSVRANETPEQMDSKATEFKPDAKQREALDKEKERVDTLTKTANSQLGQMNTLVKTLDSNSKMSKGVIMNALARASGEVGALTEGDKAPFVGSQAVLDRLAQWIDTNVSSEVTESNKKEIRNLLKIYVENVTQAKKGIYENSQNSLAQIHNIPPTFTSKALGDLKPLTSEQKSLLTGEKDDGSVTVQGPSGQRVKMKKEAADKYLSKPGYKIVE